MSVVDLINYLRLEGPHNQERVPQLVRGMPHPRGLTDEEGDFKGDGVVLTEVGPIEGGTLRRTLARRNRWNRRTPREILERRNRWKRRTPRRIPTRRNG